jgi:hypothetical protein
MIISLTPSSTRAAASSLKSAPAVSFLLDIGMSMLVGLMVSLRSSRYVDSSANEALHALAWVTSRKE